MFRNPIISGLVLFIITMICFFITYNFFGGKDFFNNSLIVNAFVLPALYCLFAFFSVRFEWKERKMNFKEIFRRSFLPIFIGGVLSVLSIASYLNFVNPKAKQLLNNQFIERNKSELTAVFNKEKSRLKTEAEIKDLEKDYNKSLQSFNEGQVRGKDVFTFKNFVAYFGAILIFYTIISAFFGAFLRDRTSLNN